MASRARRSASVAALAGLVLAGLSVAPRAVASATPQAAAPVGGSAAVAAAAAARSAVATSANSRPGRAGAPPQWIQQPYLTQNPKGRIVVTGSVYVDPFKGRNPKAYAKKAAADRLSFRVIVAKDKYSQVDRSHAVAMLPHHALLASKAVKISVSGKGVITLSVTLPKKASNALKDRGFAGKAAAVTVVVTQAKDTGVGEPRWALKQVAPVEVTKAPFSAKYLKRATRIAADLAATYRSEETPQALTQPRHTSTPDSPYYNTFNVRNWTPFVQNIAINPNINCMWTGSDPSADLSSAPTTVPPSGDVQFWYLGTSTKSKYPGVRGASSGMNVPGTQSQTLLGDLSHSVAKSVEGAKSSVTDPATYSEEGLMNTAASAALTFVTSFISGIFRDKSTCDTQAALYPELFGVASQVVGFGYDNDTDAVQALNGNGYPDSWLWAGRGTLASGNMRTTSPPADPQAWALTDEWVDEYLQPMLGAQTVSSYYWNGGQSAPMVSDKVSGTPGNYNGGSATYQGGLFQFVGESPGTTGATSACSPGSNNSETCKYTSVGSVQINLQYLTNPQFSSGLNWYRLPSADPVPNMQVQQTPSGGYQLTCDLKNLVAQLTTPYGYSAVNGGITTAQGGTMVNQAVNASGQLPENANWLVNFFGIAEVDGEPQNVYYGNSWQQQDQTGGTTYAIPGVGPGSTGQTIGIAEAAGGGSQTVAVATVQAANLKEFYTADGTKITQDQLQYFGCNATPMISLNGLSVISASGSPIANQYGAIDSSTNLGWPMPGNRDGWPTTSFGSGDKRLNYTWMTPVKQLNVTFQGTPVGSTAAIPSS